jgi:hypothetical protein
MSEKLTPPLHRLLDEGLADMAPEASFDHDAGIIVVPVGGMRARISTDSLAESASRTSETRWPETVRTWLADMLGAARGLADRPSGFDPDLLRLQAVPREQRQTASLAVPWGSAFDLLLRSADVPGLLLQPSDLEAVGWSLDEAFRRALDQTIDEIVRLGSVQTQPITQSTGAVVVARDGWPFMSAAITVVQHFAGADLPVGAVVAVPDHCTMAVLAVRSRANLTDLAPFAAVTADLYAQAEWPCSPDLYWWTGEDLRRITDPRRMAHDPAGVAPEELRAAVERLPPT